MPGTESRTAASNTATLERYPPRSCLALAEVVNRLHPEAASLGREPSNLDFLHTRLPEAMRPRIHSDVLTTPILKNELGDSAGVIGAAWLWPGEGEVASSHE